MCPLHVIHVFTCAVPVCSCGRTCLPQGWLGRRDKQRPQAPQVRGHSRPCGKSRAPGLRSDRRQGQGGWWLGCGWEIKAERLVCRTGLAPGPPLAWGVRGAAGPRGTGRAAGQAAALDSHGALCHSRAWEWPPCMGLGLTQTPPISTFSSGGGRAGERAIPSGEDTFHRGSPALRTVVAQPVSDLAPKSSLRPLMAHTSLQRPD